MGISNGLYVLGKATEPSLADKLAQAEMQRRSAVRARESKETKVAQITAKIDNKNRELMQFEDQLKQSTKDAEKNTLQKRIDEQKKEIKDLEDEMSKATKELEDAKNEEINLGEKYKEILNNLNKAIEKESGAVSWYSLSSISYIGVQVRAQKEKNLLFSDEKWRV